MKILQRIAQIVLTIILGLALFVTIVTYQKYSATALKERPYPFFIENPSNLESEIFENSDILIIGDNFALKNDKLIEILTDNLSKGLKKPLTIQNMAYENENLYRVKTRLLSLKKLPPVIILMGGTSEFSEDLYPPDLTAFKENFKRAKNEYVSTIITLYPNLSKILFLKDENKKLSTNEIKPFIHYSDEWFQKIAEATYYFYQEELGDLIDFIREKNSNLIIVNAPKNLELRPKKPCDNSIIDAVTIEQMEITKLIKEEQLKEALQKTLNLDERSTGNAVTKYLLGEILLKQGKNKAAVNFLKQAQALDCQSTGANIIINEINKAISKDKSILNINFDEMLYTKIGEDTLFLNDEVIQFIHWDLLTESLTKSLKEILQL